NYLQLIDVSEYQSLLPSSLKGSLFQLREQNIFTSKSRTADENIDFFFQIFELPTDLMSIHSNKSNRDYVEWKIIAKEIGQTLAGSLCNSNLLLEAKEINDDH